LTIKGRVLNDVNGLVWKQFWITYFLGGDRGKARDCGCQNRLPRSAVSKSRAWNNEEAQSRFNCPPEVLLPLGKAQWNVSSPHDGVPSLFPWTSTQILLEARRTNAYHIPTGELEHFNYNIDIFALTRNLFFLNMHTGEKILKGPDMILNLKTPNNSLFSFIYR